MAISAQGMSISWNGTAIAEPISLSVSGGQTAVIDVTGRNTGYAKIYESAGVDLGSVSVEAYGFSLNMDSVGIKAGLTISGPLSWSVQAIFEGFEVSASAGEPVRFSYRFKVSGNAS